MQQSDLENLFAAAIQALKGGRWQQAQLLLHDLTGLWPECKEAWYQLGELYQQRGEWARAVEMYTRVLELDPGIQEVYFNLGLMAAQQLENDLASAYWSQALTINPAFHDARLQLALMLARSGQVPEAIAHLRSLLELGPELAALLLQQARAALQQGQLLEASAFCQALRQGSTYESARVLQLEIQVLHELGLDSFATELLSGLNDPWAELLREIYVPAHYASAATLDQARDQLDLALASPPRFRLPAIDDLPRLRGWYLLGRAEQVDAWLLQAMELPPASPASLQPPPSRQLLVWVVDAGCLPWQAACWRHLAALPARSWEIQLLLRQESLKLLLQIPVMKSLSRVSVLPDGMQAALELLNQLQPQVLLLGNPELDGLQFWLMCQRSAPLQLAWPTRWPQPGFRQAKHSKLACDGSAGLWLPLPAGAAAGQELVYPLPAQGWSPQDLAGLRSLPAAGLRLLATPGELGALQQLLHTLEVPIAATIWRSPGELANLLGRSAALLLPEAGAGPYAQAAASCGLPLLPMPQDPEQLQALLGQVNTLGSEPRQGPDPDWQAQILSLPETNWAVTLQDWLTRARRKK
ncbi:MAG TPA: tetratricopeptide repeat protein [Candidatus Obscuribacterales bacterium]